MKLMITGGHIAPALAVIDEILKNHKDVNLVFVGRNHPLECQEVTKRKIKFIILETGRLTRILSFKSLINFLKVFPGLWQSYKVISQEKPDKILSFGGYLALPIAIAARLKNIPVYTHEQTAAPGLSNKIISKFANITFVSFPESINDFNTKKTVLTGNPIRTSIFNIIKKPFLVDKSKPVIYVTGGSLGSHSINIHIKDILTQLLKKYVLIHQTGDSTEYKDYEDLIKLKEALPENLKKNYHVRKFFNDEQIGYIFSVSDLIISRAGANTFFEILHLKKPAILVPLPWSANGEQKKHAQIFQENNLGEIFDQSDTSQKLIALIGKIIGNINYYQKNFETLKSFNKQNAAQKIIKILLEAK